MIANPPDHRTDRHVIGIRFVFGNETDVTGNSRNAEDRGKIAHLDGSGFPQGARRRRNKSDRPLYGRDVRVIFAVVGRRYRVQRKRRRCRFPLSDKFRRDRDIAADSELPATDSEALHLVERIATRPQNHSDFAIANCRARTHLHETFSPFKFLASRIRHAMRTASADSSGRHRIGSSPLVQHSTKYASSAAYPSTSAPSTSASASSRVSPAVYSVGGLPADEYST